MSYKEMFHPELICVEVDSSSQEEVFLHSAKLLLEKGFVKESYFSGLLERENNFPTGLITQYLNIALPHTDPKHIIKPFVLIVKLKEKILFKQMGDNQEMKTKDLFFLGISDGKNQTGLLASFMSLFANEEFVKEYMEENNPEKIYQLFKKNI